MGDGNSEYTLAMVSGQKEDTDRSRYPIECIRMALSET